jgi:hypothetical protein
MNAVFRHDVVGVVSRDDLRLLPPGCRWTLARKALLVALVEADILSFDDALARFAMSAEEFTCYSRRVRRYGLKGLRNTRAKMYLQHEEGRRGQA